VKRQLHTPLTGRESFARYGSVEKPPNIIGTSSSQGKNNSSVEKTNTVYDYGSTHSRVIDVRAYYG